MQTSSEIQRKLKTTNKVHSMILMILQLTRIKKLKWFNKVTLLKVALFSEKAKEQWTLWDSNNNLWTNNKYLIRLNLFHNNKIECRVIIIQIWTQTEFKSHLLMLALQLIWKIKVSIQIRINNCNKNNNFWCNNHITWLNNKNKGMGWTKSKSSTSLQI